MPTPLARRLNAAMDDHPEGRPRPVDLARAAGVKPPSVTDWLSGRTKKLGKALVPVARFLGVTPEWLNEGKLPMRPAQPPEGAVRVAEVGPGYDAVFEIMVIDAPGSCGGGREHMDDLPAAITKETSWFKRHNVQADDLFAIRADGDANADFIVHGDMVIFDSTKRTPETGHIYLVRHPDGLRVRRLRRDIDGSWWLQCLNLDKSRFPDEHIPADRIDLLRIEGRFVYRQGG